MEFQLKIDGLGALADLPPVKSSAPTHVLWIVDKTKKIKLLSYDILQKMRRTVIPTTVATKQDNLQDEAHRQRQKHSVGANTASADWNDLDLLLPI